MAVDYPITRLPDYQILIASTRPAKVDAVHAAVVRIAAIDSRFERATIQAIDVGAVGPATPFGERETIAGARARAAALAARASGSFLALGLEGGIAPLAIDVDGPRHALVTWAAATDGAAWSYGSGGAIALPQQLANDVLAGRELGDLIDELAGAPARGTRGAWGVLTRDLVGRRDALVIATLAALAPFYNPRAYRD